MELFYILSVLVLCIGSLFIGWLINKCPLLAGFVIAMLMAAAFYAGFVYGNKSKQIDFRPPKSMQCSTTLGYLPGVTF